MSLLSVIFALIAESFITNLSDLRRFDFIDQYVKWLRPKLPSFSVQNGSISLVLVIASILFLVWLVGAMLASVLSLFGFLFGITILVYMMGPRDLDQDTQNVITALEAKDYEAANKYASELLGRNISEGPIELSKIIKEEVLLQANTRMLGVFFWFVLLGPIGAVLFRLSCLLNKNHVNKQHENKNNNQEEDEFFAASQELYRILIWLPGRICVLSYAVAGNFVDTMSSWDEVSDLWKRNTEELIV
ncbi:MAG: regulatory signaling modulator protein AmpE, partial [Woeseiaceae bacterium]